MLSRAQRALLFGAFVLASSVATVSAAALEQCTDNVLPTIGDDQNPGFVPAGPALLAPGTGVAGYTYAVNQSDFLQFYVQSQPGVGTASTFTRKLWIALTGNDNSSYPSAAELVNPGCEVSFGFVSDLASPAAGISVTTSTSLADFTTLAIEPNCTFNHLFALAWDTFRSSAYANCGFTVTSNTTNPVNGTYKNFHGRVHIKWEDWNATTGGTLVRPAANTWYDVKIQVQDTANFTSQPVSNTETPYNANFQVSGVTYSKATSGAVTANIAYELTTAFPYYAIVNGSQASNFLIHSGTTYSGLTLAGDWTYDDVLNGMQKEDGSPCAVAGDTCKLSGVLSYTWTPATDSCSLSTSQAYQFDFTLACNSTGINSECGKPMRDALALPAFGSFRLTGNIDFCMAASTDFPISWPAAFDVVGGTTRTIGAKITTTGTLESNKKIYGIALKNYRVARSGLDGEWSLWDAGATNVAYLGSGYAGTITTVGTNTGFVFADPVSANNGLRWTVSASFTPNIKLYSTAQSFTTTTLQGPFMIVLPDDKGDSLAFTMTIDLRMYTDSTQPFARRRRLLYRDTAVQSAQPAAIQDTSASTRAITVSVPQNMQVSKDGNLTIISAPGTPVGAIAGIAAVGAVVGAASIGLAVFLVKRRQAKKEQDDAEVVLLKVMGSSEHQDYYHAPVWKQVPAEWHAYHSSGLYPSGKSDYKIVA